MPDKAVRHDLKILTHFYYDGDIIRSAAIITAQKHPVENMAAIASQIECIEICKNK